jgi:hypothetical protein
MSLINDALKRASQSEKNRPRDAGPHSAMQPASESRSSIVPTLAGVCIFILLAVAGWLVWEALPHRGNPQPAVALAKEAAPVVVTPPPPQIQPPPLVVMPPANTNPPVPPPAPVITSAPLPRPFPELKLQGIYYNRTNPKAAINGQIRAQNEQIGEVRIVTITQNKVTVEWNGQTRDLNLGGE